MNWEGIRNRFGKGRTFAILLRYRGITEKGNESDKDYLVMCHHFLGGAGNDEWKIITGNGRHGHSMTWHKAKFALTERDAAYAMVEALNRKLRNGYDLEEFFGSEVLDDVCLRTDATGRDIALVGIRSVVDSIPPVGTARAGFDPDAPLPEPEELPEPPIRRIRMRKRR